jgi:hypothetical protein
MKIFKSKINISIAELEPQESASFWWTVLPGPVTAIPPVEQKFTAIWPKHTAI